MIYLGAVQVGDHRSDVVTAIQRRLQQLGYDIEDDGVYGGYTKSAVQLFQARNELPTVGRVGPATWAALFDVEETTAPLVPQLLEDVVRAARGELGVKETPGRPNRGPRVDQYIRAAGLEPDHPQAPKRGYAWCMAFVYWCFVEASRGRQNPCVKTAHVFRHWERVDPKYRISAAAAYDNPTLVRRGCLYMMDYGNEQGHVGIVQRVERGHVIGIEGNTNEAGSREGNVVAEKKRGLQAITLGYVNYGL